MTEQPKNVHGTQPADSELGYSLPAIFLQGIKEAGSIRPPHRASESTKKRPSPVSVRFSDEERAELVRRAAGRPISRYIRDRALGKREARPLGPGLSETNLARILSLLGRSGMGVHLDELADAAKIGAFDAAPETLTAIHQACQDIAEIRRLLITALGLKVS